MADPSPPPESKPPGAPRWVKVLAIVTAVVVVLVVVVALVAGGEHGPRRHLPGGNQGNHTPPVEHSP
jgi:hypothetical protein